MYHECIPVQRLSDRKSHDPAAFVQDAAAKAKFPETGKCHLKHFCLLLHLIIPLFGAQCNPLFCQTAALCDIVLRHLFIVPVAIVHKTRYMIAFAMQFLSL